MIDLEAHSGRYALIYMDPPWFFFFGDPDKPQAAGKHYNMMSFDELAELPVPVILAKPGVVFMWVTSTHVDQGIDLLRVWGLHYRGIAYIWIKTTKDGQVIRGQGVRPSFVKPTTELVIIGSTEPRGRTLPLKTERQGQLIFAPRPPRHSEKPLEARERIEELFGDIPRIELFARYKYPGWETWGLEAEGPMPADQAVSPKLKERLTELETSREIMRLMEELPQEG